MTKSSTKAEDHLSEQEKIVEIEAAENESIESDEVHSLEADAEDEDEEDEKSAEESEDDDEFPLKKKAKRSKHDDGSADFSSAVNAILSSHLKAYDRKDPIMARNKKVLRKNEADKLEQRAKRALLVEKKKQLNKARKREIIPTVSDELSGEEIRNILEKEAALRKIARKGVVKLFNAILSTQVTTAKQAESGLGDIRNKEEREQLITEVSKEKFLDMVKSAAEEV
ncbi:hypothetical protein HG536_0C02170 [Torulaspora globosa]|uniref:Rrp15p-domain-containing protein n=1 Tax=Torulaspora globosa TaxID=48254 RepID=A0A7G3ZEW2_9SACH|nr:uncharacterized protein HG536_0C02170 [Torulaspora globosa]QLL32048.1 hypothetical protein HG536_0C02170 [Torulaspora globosa]